MFCEHSRHQYRFASYPCIHILPYLCTKAENGDGMHSWFRGSSVDSNQTEAFNAAMMVCQWVCIPLLPRTDSYTFVSLFTFVQRKLQAEFMHEQQPHTSVRHVEILFPYPFGGPFVSTLPTNSYCRTFPISLYHFRLTLTFSPFMDMPMDTTTTTSSP